MSIDQKPLDVDWLWDFIALAEHQHFSRAADARSIAQPAFSRHIRALEEWADVQLVDRNAHPAALTDAGQAFLIQTRSIVAHLEAARIKARMAHDQSNARLRFASTHSLSLSFFPSWLTRLESRLRLGQVQTLSDSYEGCEELMQQRKVQFVLCYGHASVLTKLDEAGYAMQPMGTDDLLAVCAAKPDGQALYRLDATAGVQQLLHAGAHPGQDRHAHGVFTKGAHLGGVQRPQRFLAQDFGAGRPGGGLAAAKPGTGRVGARSVAARRAARGHAEAGGQAVSTEGANECAGRAGVDGGFGLRVAFPRERTQALAKQ